MRIKLGRVFQLSTYALTALNSLQKHGPGASRSRNILTSVCYHADALIGIHLGRGKGFLPLEKYGLCQLEEVYF